MYRSLFPTSWTIIYIIYLGLDGTWLFQIGWYPNNKILTKHFDIASYPMLWYSSISCGYWLCPYGITSPMCLTLSIIRPFMNHDVSVSILFFSLWRTRWSCLLIAPIFNLVLFLSKREVFFRTCHSIYSPIIVIKRT